LNIFDCGICGVGGGENCIFLEDMIIG